jgi:hypothetical protein
MRWPPADAVPLSVRQRMPGNQAIADDKCMIDPSHHLKEAGFFIKYVSEKTPSFSYGDDSERRTRGGVHPL